jgi:hypothetical protein
VTKERLLDYIGGLHPDRDGLIVSQLEDLITGWEAEVHCFVVDYEGDAGGVREGTGIRLPEFDELLKSVEG